MAQRFGENGSRDGESGCWDWGDMVLWCWGAHGRADLTETTGRELSQGAKSLRSDCVGGKEGTKGTEGG